MAMLKEELEMPGRKALIPWLLVSFWLLLQQSATLRPLYFLQLLSHCSSNHNGFSRNRKSFNAFAAKLQPICCKSTVLSPGQAAASCKTAGKLRKHGIDQGVHHGGEFWLWAVADCWWQKLTLPLRRSRHYHEKSHPMNVAAQMPRSKIYCRNCWGAATVRCSFCHFMDQKWHHSWFLDACSIEVFLSWHQLDLADTVKAHPLESHHVIE